MALRLSIENMSSLPDGGPLDVVVTGQRGIDIGRDQHLDWTLPDPSRTISGKHCEIRFKDGGYVLTDVSTNGTFLNGGDRRLQAPHRLHDGDKLEIGHYIVRVAIDGAESGRGEGRSTAPPPPAPHEIWAPVGDVAPPMRPADFRPAAARAPVQADYLDWVVDQPGVHSGEAQGRPPPPFQPEDDWATGPPRPVPVEPDIPPTPSPRRPQTSPAAGDNPWVASAAPPAPAPAQPPPPVATTPAASPATASAERSDVLARFARGAGLPEDLFAGRDAGELAEEIGAIMRVVAEDLRQLLAARSESKRLARSTQQTTIEALDNNPLKFSPTAADALRVMFGPPSAGYLGARRTVEQSFRDLKAHQIKTYAAMQAAVRMLAEDLDPDAIDESLEGDKGLGALIGSRKARLWEAYVTRWDAKTAPHEDGLVDVFMLYFADCYDRGGGPGR
jgi:type VI secretion system protein ImpI